MTYPKGGSEFGGFPGLVQPSPHEPTPEELVSAVYATDPDDPASELSTPEAVIEQRRKDGAARLGK